MDKQCFKCGEVKELSHFYKRTVSIDGYRHTCKECITILQKTRYHKNKDKILKQMKKYFLTAKGRATAKARNKKRNLKNPERAMVYRITNRKLKRLPCQVCGELKVDGHHDDYAKPREVMWLCRQHHQQLHNSMKDWQVLFDGPI